MNRKVTYWPDGRMYKLIVKQFNKGRYDFDIVRKSTKCTHSGYVLTLSHWIKFIQKDLDIKEKPESINDGSENKMLKEKVYQRKNIKPKERVCQRINIKPIDHRSLYIYEDEK